MKHIATTIAGAVLGFGCVRPPNTLELRMNLPLEDVDFAMMAADEWEEATGCTFGPRLITPYGCSRGNCVYVNEMPADQLNNDAFGRACTAKGTTGCSLVTHDIFGGDWRAHIRVAETTREIARANGHDPDDAVRLTFLHELGHALGLQHDDGNPARSVMKAQMPHDAEHPTYADWWQYQSIRMGPTL